MERFSRGNEQAIKNILRNSLHHDERVHPLSSIIKALADPESTSLADPESTSLSAFIESRSRLPPQENIKSEMSAMLRILDFKGEIIATAFLIADNVALTSGIVTGGVKKGEEIYVERTIIDTTEVSRPPKFERVAVSEIVDLTERIGFGQANVVALKLARPLMGVKPFRIAENSKRVRILGREVHLIAIGAKDPRLPDWMLELYKREFGLPTYLNGTVLRYGEGNGELAYDVLTTGGSAGAPVVDDASGAVIGVNYKGFSFGDLTKIAAGLEVVGLGGNETLRRVLGFRPVMTELADVSRAK